ncbi:MAG: hypothetical protein HY903_03425 [Deltaproteobacteria bacterium]|nr:hypothetical protein [Deltaproteobacteria bacterium]
MPSFPSVKQHTERLLGRGLGADACQEICQLVCGERAPYATPAGRLQLAQITELYHSFFTRAGRDKWQELTGIVISDTRVSYPKQYLPTQRLVALRTELQRQKQHVDARFTVAHDKTGDVRVTAVKPAAEKPVEITAATIRARLTPKMALDAAVPSEAMTWALALSGSPAVETCYQKIVAFERDHGNNDGKLAPRDALGADPVTARLLALIYEAKGKRELPLSEIKATLPAAIVTDMKSGINRGRPELRALLVDASPDTLVATALRYVTEVRRGDVIPATFTAAAGYRSGAVARLLAVLREVLPPPSLEERGRLYQRLLDGKLARNEFFGLAMLSKETFAELQLEHPEVFPRPAGLASDRAVPDRSGHGREVDVAGLSKLWHQDVIRGRMPVPVFCTKHGVREGVMRRVKEANRGLFPDAARGRGTTSDLGERLEPEVIAQALATRLKGLAAADPFADVGALLATLNADKAFTARFGTFNRGRYNRLRVPHGALFDNLVDQQRWMNLVKPEVVRLRQKRPNLDRARLVEAVQKTYPSFSLWRLRALDKAYPGIAPNAHSGEATVAKHRRQVGKKIAAMLAADPDVSAPTVAKTLSAKGYAITAAQVHEAWLPLRKTKGTRTDDYTTLPARKVYELVARIAPIGASQEEVWRVTTTLLARQGLAPLELPGGSPQHLSKLYPSLAQITSHRAAAVVAEYAAAAPRGATPEAIFAQVVADYPALARPPWNLSRYARLWDARPESYPELKAFTAAGRLKLVGKGIEGTPRRFRDRLSPARALFGGSADELAELARLSRFALIPVKEPLLEHVLETVTGKPLVNTNVLRVAHLLGHSYALTRAMARAGAVGPSTTIVGTPYGSSDVVAEAIRDLGIDVRVPALSMASYRKEVEKALDDVVARYRKNRFPIHVLDDGGLVAELLHTKAKYKDVLGVVEIVEQTTGGILKAEKHALGVPVLNVARSESKQEEGLYIGEIVAAKVLQALSRLGSNLEGKVVTVVGYGFVGKALAAILTAAGARVQVVESNPVRAKDATELYGARGRAEALKSADIIIGVTGEPSLTMDEVRTLKDGVVLASASSKRVELPMEEIEAGASHRTVAAADSPLSRCRTVTYTLGKKKVTVLGDGYPVNFDGDVENVPADRIQLTDAAMLAGSLQVRALPLGNRKNTGLVTLDPEVDRDILETHRELMRRRTPDPIQDPALWQQGLLAIARLFVPARPGGGDSGVGVTERRGSRGAAIKAGAKRI